jgi:hypothetical protein
MLRSQAAAAGIGYVLSIDSYHWMSTNVVLNDPIACHELKGCRKAV